MTSRRGLICAQHYEHRPAGEAAPVFTVEPKDAPWYRYFADEAERLWEDGTPWPLSPADQVARERRPVFSEDFGAGLTEAIDGARELLVTGMACNPLVNNGYGKLEERLRAGTRTRFVLIDPHSPAIATAASRYHAVRSPESARERVLHTLRVLAELKRSTGGAAYRTFLGEADALWDGAEPYDLTAGG